jgi:hypothetical protein
MDSSAPDAARLRCAIADVPAFIHLASSGAPTTSALADHAASIVSPMCGGNGDGVTAGAVCASREAQVAWCAQEFYLANCRREPPGPLTATQPWLCDSMRQLAEGGGAGIPQE